MMINTAPREIRLPVKLMPQTVYLLDQDTEAERWTLGPDWYNQYAEDLVNSPIPPYHEPRGSRDTPARATTILDTDMDDVHRWAETAISLTSDMTVTSWANPHIPALSITKYMIDIKTVDKSHFRFRVNKTVANNMERILETPDNTLRLFMERDGDNWTRRLLSRATVLDYTTRQTVIIPIRGIANVRLTSVTMKVDNR